MAMWVDSDPTSRDRANSVILQTAAGLKKCLEEGADCKLLKGLGWSEKVTNFFLNYAIWGVQQRWTKDSEEKMLFAKIEDGKGRSILVLKKYLANDDADDEGEIMEEEAREVGGILQGSSPEEVEMAHAAARLALEGEEDGEGPGASQPGSARQRGKYEGAVPMSNYYL